jgi:hypothetical protein
MIRPLTNLWAYLALALAALLFMQTLRLTDAERDTAQAVATLATERANTERQARTLSENYRKLEGDHRADIDKIRAEASAALASADVGRDRAVLARNRLQRDLANYLTQHRTAAQARALATGGQADTAALDLLAELQRRADDRAGALAHIADTARARGLACERSHDAASTLNAQSITAAGHAQAQ